MQKQRPVMLVILDGFGWREDAADNAVVQARKPSFDALWAGCPHAFLRTSGKDVGLPEGQMGNSEVGHLNIGAGRVVMQDLPRIGAAIQDGSLARDETLRTFIANLRSTGGTCHLVGLVSPGGVHGHQDHAAALARIVSEAGVPVAFHVWTDGRDTPPQSGAEAIERLTAALPKDARIATVSGRYYAMDRDNRWERVQKAYAAMAEGEGAPFPSAAAVLDASYAADVTDEFVVPAVIDGYQGMKDGDGLLSFNFRADRVREILSALVDPAFTGFARKRKVRFISVLGMTEYSEALDRLMKTLFRPQSMHNILGEVAAKSGRTQLRMAETEKYPHVTYFLNGGEETPFPG